MTSLADLLFDKDEDVAQTLRTKIDKLGTEFLAAVPASHELPRQLAEVIAAFLGTPVSDLLLVALEKHQAVREARESTRDGQGATSTVLLVEHELTSNQRPTIDAVIAGETITIGALILSLNLRFEAVSVNVREGRISGLGDATASSSAELSIQRPGNDAQPHVLAAKDSGQHVLFPSLQFHGSTD